MIAKLNHGKMCLGLQGKREESFSQVMITWTSNFLLGKFKQTYYSYTIKKLPFINYGMVLPCEVLDIVGFKQTIGNQWIGKHESSQIELYYFNSNHNLMI